MTRRARQGTLPPRTTLTRFPLPALVWSHETSVSCFDSAQKIWVHGGSAPCPTRPLPPYGLGTRTRLAGVDLAGALEPVASRGQVEHGGGKEGGEPADDVAHRDDAYGLVLGVHQRHRAVARHAHAVHGVGDAVAEREHLGIGRH